MADPIYALRNVLFWHTKKILKYRAVVYQQHYVTIYFPSSTKMCYGVEYDYKTWTLIDLFVCYSIKWKFTLTFHVRNPQWTQTISSGVCQC